MQNAKKKKKKKILNPSPAERGYVLSLQAVQFQISSEAN